MAEEITVSDLSLEIEAGGWVLDVREDFEFEDGHVPQAHHIPLNSVPDRFSEVPTSERIFVICKSGRRSQTAADFLASKGYDVVSVAGGTDCFWPRGVVRSQPLTRKKDHGTLRQTIQKGFRVSYPRASQRA
jgi:rhodanese-related sulfurtransferase